MTTGSRATNVMRAVFTSGAWSAAFVRWLLLVLFAVAALYWVDPFSYRTHGLGLFWRNALPLVMLALLLYALSGRWLTSIGISVAITWLIFKVNGIKQQQMHVPLMPGDWVLQSQLLRHVSFFSHYTGHSILLLGGIVLFIATIGALWWLERRWPRPHWGTRVLCIALPMVVLYTAFRGERPWVRIYSDAHMPGYQSWDPMPSVKKVGLMANLVRMSQESRIRIPKADRSLVADFAASHAQSLRARIDRTPPAQLPDIVVVQSEAFFDPSILKGVEPGEFAPNFDHLAATGVTGSLVTPAYGGGTIRTEFEALTGYPMRAFPSVAYPYYGLVGQWMPSVPRRLQAFGYSTTLYHPFEGNFWNRQEVMPLLGFEQSHYEQDFAGAARAGRYISDRALFDVVLAQLARESAAPSYSFVITMENHGPWDSDPIGVEHMLDGRPLPAGLSAKGKRQFKYYAAHLVNGDAALGDFVQRLMARPRWTILLFYGDHLPSLDTAFSDLGFDDGGTYAQEHTHYMLVSNRPLKPRRLDLSAYELPGLLFDTAGLPLDGYLAFDGAIRQAAAAAPASKGPHFGQISFNAARVEVRCERKLNVKGKCRKPLL